jgi:hypothetical protein
MRQLLNGSRPSGPAWFNSKLAHLRYQGGPRQTKSHGRAVHSADQSIGFPQYFQNVLPLGVG